MLKALLNRGAALLLGVLCLLAAGPAAATHLLGGEMTYRYLDSNGPATAPVHYEITVTIYNNALPGSANPNTDALIGIYDQATGAKIRLAAGINVLAGSGANVSNGSLDITSYTISPVLTPSLPAGCAVQGPYQPFRLQKFTGQVYLPASLNGFYAVFTRSARNVDITNYVTSGNNQPLTLFTTLAPPLRPNRSPVFSDTAVAIVCQGDTTISLNNAVDADGDRLVYSFGTPYGTFQSGSNLPQVFPPLPNTLGYYGIYTVGNPFGTGPGNFAILDASTGIAKYGGTTQGKYVVAVDVQEYRTINGREVLIGTTRRDLQLIVAACPSTAPPVLPAVASLPRAYTIEAGQSLTIPFSAMQAGGHPLLMTVNSTLLDGAGPLDATFNGSQGTVLAGALTGTATATGAGAVAGSFVYNSSCGDARPAPYDVAVTVKDQGCAGKTVADVFRITVTLPTGPTAIAGDLVACDQTSVHSYSASGGTAPGVRWRVVGGTIVGSATANPVQVRWTASSGTLVAKGVSQYGCLTDSVSQGVTVVPAPALTVAGSRTICQGGSTTISVSGAGAAYTVTGGPVTGAGSTFVLTPTQTTTYTITSVQLATGGCPSIAQVTVTVNPTPAAEPIVGAASVCPTVGGIAYTVQNPANSNYQWTVTGGTIASGQGTTAITVNWDAAGTGLVSVLSTNSLGCQSAPSTLPVTINRVLQTIKPSGPTSVCQADGPYSYTTPAVNGSSFAWQLFGSAQGTLTSTGNSTSIQFSTAGVGKLVVTQTSNPAGGICRGVSDTLYITVQPSPSPALAIQGPDRFCVNSGAQAYTLGGASSSTYAWQLNGAALASTGSSVGIPASTAAGTYTLTARETNSGGCAGPLYTKTFTVDPRPGTLVIQGPRFVCPATRTLTYTVPNAASISTFQWTVTGGTVASGQGTASITVNFPTTLTTNATVSVTETSQYGCAGQAVAIMIVPDNAQAPQLTLASVQTNDNTHIDLTFSMPSATNVGNLTVLRRVAGSGAAFTPVVTMAPTGTNYTDTAVDAAQNAYEYTLSLTNACGDVLPGITPHTTVLLRAVAVPGTPGTPRDQGGSNLTWTPYLGFTVASYQVYQENDNGGYTLLGTVPGSTSTYHVPNTGQGFSQCFRVVAVSNDTTPRLSNSNRACVEFTNGLAFYNIITPNNDGQNDKLEILNVRLYPGNTMQIFNRWGREVFSTTNYNNENNYWGTDPSVAPGVYYYLFKLPNGSTTKGWVEVVK